MRDAVVASITISSDKKGSDSFSGRTMLTTISVDYRDANKVHGFGENLAYTVECHAIQVSYKPFVLLLKISMTQDVLEHLTG